MPFSCCFFRLVEPFFMEIRHVRKLWACLLFVNLVFFAVGLGPYLAMSKHIHPFQVGQILLDVVIIHGLYGYVVRRPISHQFLRLLYLVLVPVIGLRVVLVVYFVGPNLLPWVGASEQYVSWALVAPLPLAVLTAIALWRYATREIGLFATPSTFMLLLIVRGQ